VQYQRIVRGVCVGIRGHPHFHAAVAGESQLSKRNKGIAEGVPNEVARRDTFGTMRRTYVDSSRKKTFDGAEDEAEDGA
jgi:hypothetical protein